MPIGGLTGRNRCATWFGMRGRLGNPGDHTAAHYSPRRGKIINHRGDELALDKSKEDYVPGGYPGDEPSGIAVPETAGDREKRAGAEATSLAPSAMAEHSNFSSLWLAFSADEAKSRENRLEQRAFALAQAGRYEESIAAWNTLVALEYSSLPRVLRAMCFLELGRIEEANADCDVVLSVTPEFTALYGLACRVKGDCLFETGNVTAAVAAYLAAISSIDNDEFPALVNMVAQNFSFHIHKIFRYNDQMATDLNAVAARLKLLPEDAERYLEQAAAELTARETTGRATEPPRPEPRPDWKDYKGKMELPDFVIWAYAAERKAGTLSKATLHGDKELYPDYFTWRRRRHLPPEVHWLRDLPTGIQKRKQQLTEAGVNPAPAHIEDFTPTEQEVIRRYEAGKKRGYRVRSKPSPSKPSPYANLSTD